MVTCRPDVSTSVVRCAQHSACPAHQHYKTVRHIVKYLYMTKNDDICITGELVLSCHCQSTQCHNIKLPLNTTRPSPHPLEPAISADSNWAACLKHAVLQLE